MIVLFNEILTYIPTLEEHIQHLEVVLCILKEQKFYDKLSKWKLGFIAMHYLRHIIGVRGVKVHEENIWAIWDFPVPWAMTMLRGFLGIYTYYKKFLKGFS